MLVLFFLGAVGTRRCRGKWCVFVGSERFQICDGKGRVEALGADLGTVEYGVALIELHVVGVEELEALLPRHVAGVGDPSVCLEKSSWAQVLVVTALAPPVTGTGGGAAGAKDAFVESVQAAAVGLGLEGLGGSVFGVSCGQLQPRADGFVLLVEVGKVRNEIPDHRHVWEWVDLDFSTFSRISDFLNASERVFPSNVH